MTAVTGAIRNAAQTTGASFEHLLATAKVESNLNPDLTMRTSTATGLFQFLEQTWLGVMKHAGNGLGYSRYADAIQQTKTGRYVVPDPALRDEMMRLRKDPTANAVMGGAITQHNAEVLRKRIGRQPTDGELYVAHFFGPYAASKVIRLADTNPQANAAEMFPAAARANLPIFYDKAGNARSIAGVYGELVRRYQVARASPTPGLAPVLTARAPAPAGPASAIDTAGLTSAFAGAAQSSSGLRVSGDLNARPAAQVAALEPTRTLSGFHSLFSTEERRGPVSAVVAALWGAPGTPTAPIPPAPVPPAAEPGAPLDLFQEQRPRARGLFDGSA
jgi:hypothetical protein